MFKFPTTISFLALSTVLQAADLPPIHDHRDNVLGSSFDMTLYGVREADALPVIGATLAEVQRLEAIFSPKRQDSELALINSGTHTAPLSSEMQYLIESCEAWRTKTENAFSCRIATLQAEWQKATDTGLIPDRDYMKRIAAEAAEAAPTAVKINPTGLAKGYIIDRALARARALAPTATAIKIDIGGDAVYWGAPQPETPWQVSTVNPADNGDFTATLSLRSQAIASSGHKSRTYSVGDNQFSQIIDPRTGWPVEAGHAATVVAGDAMTADALATALSTMAIREGLKLVNGLENVEALIVASDGRQFPSAGWYSLQATKGQAPEKLWESDMDFRVNLLIPEKDTGKYRRPYISIWVTDPANSLVKSLLLLGENHRWMEENYVWWRRYGRKYDSVADGVARPTRMPGSYDLTWDGRDDFGAPIPKGHYILHVEVAREHGDHTYKKIPLTFSGSPFRVLQDAEGELGGLTITFDKPSTGGRVG